MALPTLTPEQRADALAKAQAARKKRSELLASVKAGKTSIAQVLAKTDDITKKTKIAQVIKALPGYGPAKAAAVYSPTLCPATRSGRAPIASSAPYSRRPVSMTAGPSTSIRLVSATIRCAS